jgi:ribonuclease VapC
MSEAVLDSSAVLAVLLAEPGAEIVRPSLPGALVCAVNVAEVVSKLVERGMPAPAARQAIVTIGVEIVDFGVDLACLTGDLHTRTRGAGLSLGDRACLALAQQRDLPAMTADRAWGQVPGCKVVFIRGDAAGL